MSREWSVLYGAMLTRVKYRKLSPAGRGALLHCLLLGGFQSPEATWDDPEELREALRLDGYPADVLEELIGLRWLDLEDGVLSIHDWDEHQRAGTTEVRRTWEAARKKDWRRRSRLGSAEIVPPTPPSSREEKKREEKRVRDMSRTLASLSSKGPAMRPDQIPHSKNVVKDENGTYVPTSPDTQTDPSVKKRRPRSRPVTRDASTPTALGAEVPADITIGTALFLEDGVWKEPPE